MDVNVIPLWGEERRLAGNNHQLHKHHRTPESQS
jgi:hypothetical protein